ncbi:kinesin-like protein KIF2C isoform X1 [Sebastes umbrosus]|uniref:kinesin-like protein KIF2C isoform X1 n=1 Tax=Sebastes umbrosus TaxID=72105 RepID=UPI0018A0FD68|nr:kinesin-like protein KIF2C isoform X1 [Sebastes umbrosus]
MENIQRANQILEYPEITAVSNFWAVVNLARRAEGAKMETGLSRLLVGLSVKIGRSDGRVHLATVKSVDTVKSAVMVEWNERKICRGKEVEVSELCTLNPELLDHIKAVTNNHATDPPPSATDKKYEGRLRSSRIPAPSSSSASPAVIKAEDSVVNRSQNRQTCLFQVPAPVLSPVSTSESSQANVETVHPDLPSSAVITNSVLPNQERRKNEAKPGPPPSFVREAVKENDGPERMPPPSSARGRRKTVAPQELNKGSKRLSCVAKPNDMQGKRGKFGEAPRPNQKFYEMIQDFRETLEITPLSSADHIEPHRICVCVRKRPLNKQEINKKEIDVVSVPGKGALLVHEPKQKVDLTKYLENQVFHFDFSFNETATNDLVYKFTAKPLVQSIFEGGMATCFAYGQTGSGKTHTMGGDFTGRQQNSAKGIYALAAHDVFTYLNHRRFAHLDLSPYVSFFEIYNGKVYDLLNKKAKLRVLEDERQQVQVVGLEEVYVSTAEEVIKMIQLGSACRTSGQTSANANSSRSHAILQIVLRRNDRATTLHGKFSLVDLAGNERGTDVSSNDRSTIVETSEINRSLLALKECIRSLGMNSDHIPFRMSTLTKVLRDSFIGEKSRTCMIAMVSPGMSSCEYTMNTLRYADRVKELKAKTSGAAKTQEPINSSTEEESVEETSVFDAISQVAELEEKVYEQLQRANKLFNGMGQTSYNIEEGLPDLVDHAKTYLDTVLALQTAVNQEKMARQSY